METTKPSNGKHRRTAKSDVAAGNGNGHGSSPVKSKRVAMKATRRPKRPPELDQYTIYLEEQFEYVSEALRSLVDGDFAIRLPVSGQEAFAPVAWAFNGLMERSETVVQEVEPRQPRRRPRGTGRRARARRPAPPGPGRPAWTRSTR